VKINHKEMAFEDVNWIRLFEDSGVLLLTQ
jgi:hypothetical protein